MATYYFQDTNSDQDPSNSSNWWDTEDQSGSAGYTPTASDDCYIIAGVTCASDNFSHQTLTNLGTLTVCDNSVDSNSGTIITNNGTVIINGSYAIVTLNNGTVETNYGTVTANANIITYSYGDGVVTSNTGTITNNDGTVTTNSSGGYIGSSTGEVTTNAGGAIIINNDLSGIITTNDGTVNNNYATITTNNGIVTNNIYTGIIVNQNGTLGIGRVSGGTGTIVANGATDLSNQTAGANVTFPSGSITWW